MIRRLVAISLLLFISVSSTPLTPGARGSFSRGAASTDVDQRTWLVGLQSYAALGNWLLSKLSGAERGRPMIAAPPVTAFSNSLPFFVDPPTNLTVTATSDTTVSLSWTAPAGFVDHYQVERSTNVTGSFVFLANATATSFNDTALTTDHA